MRRESARRRDGALLIRTAEHIRQPPDLLDYSLSARTREFPPSRRNTGAREMPHRPAARASDSPLRRYVPQHPPGSGRCRRTSWRTWTPCGSLSCARAPQRSCRHAEELPTPDVHNPSHNTAHQRTVPHTALAMAMTGIRVIGKLSQSLFSPSLSQDPDSQNFPESLECHTQYSLALEVDQRNS